MQSATSVLWVRRRDDAVQLILERSSGADLRRSLPPLPQPNVAGIELIPQAIFGMVQMAGEAPLDAPAASAASAETQVADVADAAAPGASGDPARATQRRSLPLSVALGYRAYLRGDEPLAHGPQLALELTAGDAATRAFGRLSAGLRRSAAQRIESLELTTSAVALAAAVGVATPGGEWALSAALDYAVERTVASIEQPRDDPTLRSLPGAGGQLATVPRAGARRPLARRADRAEAARARALAAGGEPVSHPRRRTPARGGGAVEASARRRGGAGVSLGRLRRGLSH